MTVEQRLEALLALLEQEAARPEDPMESYGGHAFDRGYSRGCAYAEQLLRELLAESSPNRP